MSLTSHDEPLTALRGCGPKTVSRLNSRGLNTLSDLAFFLPTAFEDRRKTLSLETAVDGEAGSMTGEVEKVVWAGPPGRRHLEVVLGAGGGSVTLIWFKARKGFAQKFVHGSELCASGKIRRYRKRLQMIHPDIRPKGSASEGIVARYPKIQGIPAKRVRDLCRQASDLVAKDLDDGISSSVLDLTGLPPLGEAVWFLHHLPEDLDAEQTDAILMQRHPAQLRWIFGELYLLQLELLQKRMRWAARKAIALEKLSGEELLELQDVFGFVPTSAQARAMEEIGGDLSRDRPMQRLLSGDVGSGKTAVAFAAAHQALKAGVQVAFMAPTEVLAQQQTATLSRWGASFGHRVCLLTGQSQGQARQRAESLLETGAAGLVVGTHALLSETTRFHGLGLLIIDEQHRFGVAQRQLLRDKGTDRQHAPHLLVMTATPIPRSLALTIQGDLDLSMIDELPRGRVPCRTHLFTHDRKKEAFCLLKELLTQKASVYVVCPAVDESDQKGLTAAKATASRFRKAFPELGVGLLHGRMKPSEKQQSLERFAAGTDKILVATTVIEVGLDVPQASVILVVDAQRFGLSQLHQLRGRVGRSPGMTSHCLLLAGPEITDQAIERLETLVATNDGFKVAEVDLAQRGFGDLLGTAQKGFKGLSLSWAQSHAHLVGLARQASLALLSSDPRLELPEHALLKEALEARKRRIFGAESG